MATKGNFSSEVDTPSTTSASVVDGCVTFTYEHPPIGDQPAVTVRFRGLANDADDASQCTGMTAWFGSRIGVRTSTGWPLQRSCRSDADGDVLHSPSPPRA